MKLTPLDIQRKQFPIKWKGFDTKAVDSFLELVREQVEELSRENALLKEESSRREKELAEYRNAELTLRNTLMGAQQMVQDYKNEARKEIERFRREREIQADRALQEAHKKVSVMQGDITDLRRMKRHFREELKQLLTNHLKMLDAHGSRECVPCRQGSSKT